jgi:hypothetical protein
VDYKAFQKFIWRAFDQYNISVINSTWSHAPVRRKTFSVTSPDKVYVPVEDNDNLRVINVLLVHRGNNRMILNFAELQDKICQTPLSNLKVNCMIYDLGQLDFGSQMAIFAQTDIIVAVAGTAIHNLLFMRPLSAVVIIMQPGWCEWAWMYANQAVLLDIRPYVYCTPDPLYNLGKLPGQAFGGEYVSHDFVTPHWTRRFGEQGPRMTKLENLNVSGDAFYATFQQAVGAV